MLKRIFSKPKSRPVSKSNITPYDAEKARKEYLTKSKLSKSVPIENVPGVKGRVHYKGIGFGSKRKGRKRRSTKRSKRTLKHRSARRSTKRSKRTRKHRSARRSVKGRKHARKHRSARR